MSKFSAAATAVTGGIVTVSGLSTLGLIAVSSYLWAIGSTPPPELLDLVWVLVGAHLGIAIGRSNR